MQEFLTILSFILLIPITYLYSRVIYKIENSSLKYRNQLAIIIQVFAILFLVGILLYIRKG